MHRHLIRWMLLSLILVIGVACGSTSDDNTTDETAPDPVVEPTSDRPSDIAPDEEFITPEPEAPFDVVPGQVMEPGWRTEDGIEVVAANYYTNEANTQAWVAIEVENTNDEAVANFSLIIALLDGESRERATLNAISPIQNIPAGYRFTMVAQSAIDFDLSDIVILAETAPEMSDNYQSQVGEFDLPAQVDDTDSDDNRYIVNGSISNNRGVDVANMVVAVSLYDSDGNLLAVAYAVPENRGILADGETTTLVASFPQAQNLPVDASQTQIKAVGYRVQ